MSSRLPTFIIGGAPRSGTTWLYNMLDRHPEIYLAKPVRPEPKFFLLDDEYARGLTYYASRWFSDAGSARAVGEKSTNYLERAVVADRIARDLAGVNLVFVLRNPADRAYSNYAWSRMNGYETLTFREALEHEAEHEAACSETTRYSRPHAYFSRGLYAELLEPYFARFPRRQLLVLQFEALIADAHPDVARVHEFLGVSPRPNDADGLQPANRSEAPLDALEPEGRRLLQERYRQSNADLFALLGETFSSWETE